jgi:hypothetical protein
MGMMDILGRYADARRPHPPSEIEHDFEEIASEAGPESLEDGIAEAFLSGETPPFEEMVGQLFEHSDPRTRAGLLDNVLAGLAPSAMASGDLAEVMRRYDAGARVNPASAAMIDPREIEDVVRQARRQNPGIVERVSRFYSRHPELVRNLGQVAMAIAMGRMARRTSH